jgi:hypothetical protein
MADEELGTASMEVNLASDSLADRDDLKSFSMEKLSSILTFDKESIEADPLINMGDLAKRVHR